MDATDPGRLDSEWPALPIDPGGWGRPPVAFIEPGAQPAWEPLGAPPPALAAPRPALAIGPISRRRWRRHRVPVEAAAAIILLTGLALVAPGVGGRAATKPSAVTYWTTNALPVLTKLINDCTAIADDASRPSAFAPRWSGDASHYRADLVAAQRLPAPPDPGLAPVWRSLLSQVAAASHDLGAVQDGDARTYDSIAAAGTAVREFVQAIRPAR